MFARSSTQDHDSIKAKIGIFLLAAVAACAVGLVAPCAADAANGPNEAEDSEASVYVFNYETSYYQAVYSATSDTEKVDGLTYDKATNTATLTNFNHPTYSLSVVQMGDDFKLKLVGKNELQCIQVPSIGYSSSMEIVGDGELVVNSNRFYQAPVMLSPYRYSASLIIDNTATVTIYTNEGEPADKYSVAVYGTSAPNASPVIQIRGKSNVTASDIVSESNPLKEWQSCYVVPSSDETSPVFSPVFYARPLVKDGDSAKYGCLESSTSYDGENFTNEYSVAKLYEDKDNNVVWGEIIQTYNDESQVAEAGYTQTDGDEISVLLFEDSRTSGYVATKNGDSNQYIVEEIYAGEDGVPSYYVGMPTNVNVAGKDLVLVDYDKKPMSEDEFEAAGYKISVVGRTYNHRINKDLKTTASDQVDSTWTRLAGDNRLGTMEAVTKAGYYEADTVLITTALSDADALTAAGLSSIYSAPLVSTMPDSLSSEASSAIKAMGADRAIILGGTNAVSAKVEKQLKDLGLETDRLEGENRIDTAIKIYDLGGDKWGDTCIVSKGWVTADALAAGSFAYANRAPIFLALPDGSLTDETAESIKDFKHVVVLGGTAGDAAIKDATMNNLVKSSSLDASWMRIAGDSRYDTAVQLATWATGENTNAPFQPAYNLLWSNLAIANAINFPDALVGVNISGPSNSVTLLASAQPDSFTDNIAKTVASHKDEIVTGYALGGASAISDAVMEQFQNSAK